jgi:hypothetical protein
MASRVERDSALNFGGATPGVFKFMPSALIGMD